MQSGIRLLIEEYGDQKKLRKEFGDNRIHFGRNAKTKELEVWYKPGSSAPYKVCTAVNVYHAITQLHHRSEYDKQRSKDLIKGIDERNDKLITGKEDDAMQEIRSELQNIANGRKLFMPPVRRKTSA